MAPEPSPGQLPPSEMAGPRRLGGGGSIFRLSFKTIADNEDFWWLMIGMSLFMIAVDRLSWLAEKWAAHDACKRRLIERINAEMMMFGIVAITLFIFQEVLLKLSDEGNDQFHFVDLMCSIGACTVIFCGGGLMFLLHRMTDKYRHFTSRDIDKNLDTYVMAGAFMAKWCVVPGFSFAFYMRESLGFALCDIITIDWVPWVFMLIPASIGLITAYATDGEATDPWLKLLAFVIYNFFCFLLICVFFGWVLHRRSHLRKFMGMKSNRAAIREVVMAFAYKKGDGKLHFPKVAGHFAKSLAKVASQHMKTGGEEPNYVSPETTTRIVQALCLGTAMNSSMYFCHFLYAVKQYHLSGGWHFFCILPWLASYILLPSCLEEVALVNAILCPSHEVLDRVTEDSNLFDLDCDHILRQLEHTATQGCLPIDSLEEKVKQGELIGQTRDFAKFLRTLHVSVSESRINRIKQKMDSDGDGNLTVQEFFNAVNGDPPQSTEKQGAIDLLEHLRTVSLGGDAPEAANKHLIKPAPLASPSNWGLQCGTLQAAKL
eukprot:CAMPEP_0197893416 /NCGR_PEP_ID=MMETSP1439-20131203/32742_1 /TAXON_ID=66791 /ORGANISM="Gonyaulax spinifera, Strain CCMP409" /LENGTH=543 /DNA_ID=CAMNT_0043513681 /DNA_START=45 /DNA_END=1676 /DNA_ORIENTATION=-